MSDALRIVKLEAENIKAIKAVEITPAGNLVEITGRNGQGKSSVLDSIWWALAGASAVDPVPIRTGETEARIRLDLGEIVVTRHFREGKDGDFPSRLTVETAEGARFPSPQALLDGLLGALAFDPLAFSRLPAREQYEQIRDMVGLDFDADEAANREDFAARTVTNRNAMAKRAIAEAITVPEDAPTEPVSVTALIGMLNEADKHNRVTEQRAKVRSGALDDADAEEKEAIRLESEADELRREAERLDARAANTRKDVAATRKRVADADPLPDPIDTAPIRDRIAGAEEVNAAVARRERKAALTAEAEAAEAESKRLTEAMDARKADMLARLEAADMPVDGLGMAGGAVTLHSRPLVQASDAEKLDVSCAIAMRQNARLKVLRIRDGSLLDADSKARIAANAAEAGWQVWMECVDSSGKIGIVIEAGEVANAEPPTGDLFDGDDS